jgi:hypothetical protein
VVAREWLEAYVNANAPTPEAAAQIVQAINAVPWPSMNVTSVTAAIKAIPQKRRFQLMYDYFKR